MRLAPEFCRALPAGVPAPGDDELETELSALVAAAAALWPGIVVPAEAFVRYIAERLPSDRPPLAALRTLHAGDLYLVCACTLSLPDALAAFDRRFVAGAARLVSRSDAQIGLGDELEQALRVKLLVPDGDGAPKIAAYSGT